MIVVVMAVMVVMMVVVVVVVVVVTSTCLFSCIQERVYAKAHTSSHIDMVLTVCCVTPDPRSPTIRLSRCKRPRKRCSCPSLKKSAKKSFWK